MSSRIIVADFRGGPYERGYAHGGLLGKRARELGTMEFYRDYCDAEAQAGGLTVARHLLRGLHALAAGRLSEEGKRLIAGYCVASGDEPLGIAQAAVMPDVLNHLVGSSARSAGVPVLGCTSAAVWGDYTRGGRFLVARNLDFIGNGLFDALPLVARHRPKQGIPYVTLSTGGAVVDGATGVNAEGLTVAVHQHLSTDVSYVPSGRPVLDLARELLQNARGIDEACGIVARSRMASAWSFVITSWKEKRAGVIQKTPRRFWFFEPPSPKLVFTNTFTEPTLRAHELDAPCFRESSRLRQLRASELLDAWRGETDERRLVSLLRDHFDPERHKLRGFAQTIAQPHNLVSVVMDPENGVMWVGEGPAPVCDSPFRRVELWSDEPVGPLLAGITPGLPEPQQKASAAYEKALSCWTRGRQAQTALAHLNEAHALDPEDPAYAHARGLFALKLGDERLAAECFEQGASLPDLPHRRLAQRLWLARCLDIMGKRSQALPHYAYVCERAMHKPLAKAASRGLSQACRSPLVAPDLFHAEASGY